MSYGAAERSVIDIDEFERRLRGPAPRTAADPLAELARLVTPAAAKPEALDAIFARSRQQEPVDAREPVLDDVSAFRMDELRGPVADDAAFAADALDREFDSPVADDHLHASAEPGDDWAYAPGDERPAEEAVAPRSRRPLYATAAVIAIGLIGIGSTFAFKGRGASDGALVEVKAPVGPTKVQAQATASDSTSASANSTVLDRGASPAPVTRVVTRQEQPVDLKEVAKAPRVVSLAPGSAGQLSSAPSEAGTVFAEPRKVKTVSVRPDGTIVGNATEAPAAPAQPSAAQAAKSPVRSETPKAATRVATTPKPPAENAEATARTPAAAKPVAAKPAQPKVAEANATHATTASHGGGGFVVQLAAPGNEAEAKSIASRLGQKFSGQLEGARVTVQKASDKDVYRVRTAGMSREGAVATCERIKAAGGACFVAKN